MSSFQLQILAADRVFFEGPCESLVIPTVDGSVGILANHSNAIAAIIPGELKYREEGKEEEIASVSEGLLKVESNEVLVLVDSAEHPDEIDENRARRAEARAKEELLQKKSRQEYYQAQTELARAVSRLRVKNRAK